MDVCCSHDGHRCAHRRISWDVVAIVGGEEVTVYLWEKLAPEVQRESRSTATEDANKVVLECLDGFFSHVALMIVGGNKFIRHVRFADGFLVCR